MPEDERNFSPEAVHTMQTASRHVRYLINEGYDLKQASTFVGNHFLLSERQRLAIMRSLATDEQLAGRKDKQADDAEIRVRCHGCGRSFTVGWRNPPARAGTGRTNP